MTGRDEPMVELSADETAMLADLFGGLAEEPGADAGQETFILWVMQDVKARQRRRLLLDCMPLVLGAAVMMIAALLLLPDLSVLPTLLAGVLLELSPFTSTIEGQSGVLLPLAALLLALLLPALLDRMLPELH